MRIQPAPSNVPTLRPDDPRVGHLLGKRVATGSSARAALIGFPCDLGVRINGGRVGAAAAPAAIRSAFNKLTPDATLGNTFVELLELVADAGDVILEQNIAQCHSALGEVVTHYLQQGTVPIVLGGGHETTLGHFYGYVGANRAVTLLNLDAHPDVRELVDGQPHSGCSFREAMLHSSKLCQGYIVAGLQPQSCSAAHLRFVDEHKSQRLWASELSTQRISTLFQQLQHATLVSIDLDVVDQAYAPGVSSPACGGITPALLFHFAYEAGRAPQVSSLDIVEVNPQFDRDDQTARLAALTVWHFLRGLAIRA